MPFGPTELLSKICSLYWTNLSSDFQLHSNADKGDGTVKYVLTGDGAGSLFLIDEKSGDIHATKRLDREEKAMYTLHAKVVDRTTNTELEPDTEFNIKIHDINDNAPRFEKEVYYASVPEMSEVGEFWVFFWQKVFLQQNTKHGDSFDCQKTRSQSDKHYAKSLQSMNSWIWQNMRNSDFHNVLSLLEYTESLWLWLALDWQMLFLHKSNVIFSLLWIFYCAAGSIIF